MAVASAGQFLLLKRAAFSRPSGQLNDDDFDVLADRVVVGRIFKANAAPLGTPWMWTLAFGHHEDSTPTHGYEATREAQCPPSPRAGGGSRPWLTTKLSVQDRVILFCVAIKH
jgi:hypothetical protein